MVFLDGSFHVWFGKYKYTLLLALDDATGKPFYGLFVLKESLMAISVLLGRGDILSVQ